MPTLKVASQSTRWLTRVVRASAIVVTVVAVLVGGSSTALAGNPTAGGITASFTDGIMRVWGTAGNDEISIISIRVGRGEYFAGLPATSCVPPGATEPVDVEAIEPIPEDELFIIQVVDETVPEEVFDPASVTGGFVPLPDGTVVVNGAACDYDNRQNAEDLRAALENLVPTSDNVQRIIVLADDGDDIVTASTLVADNSVPLEIWGQGGNDVLTGGGGDDEIYGGADNDQIWGGEGADFIDGGSGDDVVNGGLDDDEVTGGSGNDLVRGDRGSDKLGGGGGWDVLDYSTDGGPGGVVVDLSAGPPGTASDGWGDTDEIGIAGSTTFAAIRGKATDDVLIGHADLPTTILGGGGNDNISGGTRADVVFGEGGDDIVVASLGNDFILGGSGNDNLFGGFSDAARRNEADGSDTIFGDGPDAPLWDNIAVMVAPINTGGLAATPADPAGSDWIWGGSGSDTIYGGGGADRIAGDYYGEIVNGTYDFGNPLPVESANQGADVIYGDYPTVADLNDASCGADWIFGGNGGDLLVGGGGNDLLVGNNGADIFEGNAGDDTIWGGYPNFSDDSLEDLVDYTNAAAGVTLSLLAQSASDDGDVGADILRGIEHVIGSAFDDDLTGDTKINNIWGADGADVIRGGMGSDLLFGDDGDDILWGDLGNNSAGDADELSGGEGNDELHGEGGDDILDGGGGEDLFSGGAGTDVLSYASSPQAVVVNLRANDVNLTALGTLAIDFALPFNPEATLTPLPGGAGCGAGTVQCANTATDGGSFLSAPALDTIVSTAMDRIELLQGSGGNDVLIGHQSSPTRIWGGSGDDMLFGGTGNDQLDGGAGNDVLEGGPGDDHIIGGQNTTATGFAPYYGDYVMYSFVLDPIGGGGVTVRLDIAATGPQNTTPQNTSAGGFDRIEGIENIIGSGYHDYLTGDGKPNVIRGGAGDDRLQGRGDADLVIGNAPVATQDYLDGGPGDNEADYRLGNPDLIVVNPGVGAANDGEGGSDEWDFILSALLPNNALFVTAGPDKIISPGGSAVLEGAATGGGGVNPSDYVWRWDTEPPTPLTPPNANPCPLTDFDPNPCCIPPASLVIPTLSDRADDQPSVSPTQTTTYKLTVWSTKNDQCVVMSDYVVVAVSADLVVDAGPDKSINLGQSTQLTGTITGGVPPYTVSWTPTTALTGANTLLPTASPQVTTTYTLKVTDSLGKWVTDTVTVTVNDPYSISASADVTIAAGASTQLSVTINGGAAPYTYAWLPPDGLSAANVANPVATPASTTIYTVTVTDANGRTATDSVTVTVAQPSTPGGDGGNGGSNGGQTPGNSTPPPQSSGGGSTPVPPLSLCGFGTGASVVMLNLMMLLVVVRRRWR